MVYYYLFLEAESSTLFLNLEVNIGSRNLKRFCGGWKNKLYSRNDFTAYLSQSSKHFSLKPLRSARPQREPNHPWRHTWARPAATRSAPAAFARRALSGAAASGPALSRLRLCSTGVVPPLGSILLGVESRGYYFSTHGFLNFTCSVLKTEAHQRLRTVFCIHARRGPLGMSPTFWGGLRLTPFFFAGWHFCPSLLWRS